MRVPWARRRIIPRGRIPINKVYNDTRSEIRKITWPSREETIRLTIVVIALSIFMAAFLGLVVDGLFAQLYQRFVLDVS